MTSAAAPAATSPARAQEQPHERLQSASGEPFYTAILVDLGRPMGHVSAPGPGWSTMLPRAAFGSADVAALHGACAGPSRFLLLRDYFAWLTARLPDAPSSRFAAVQRTSAEVILACFAAAPPTPRAAETLGGVARARAEAFMAKRAAAPDLTAEAIARDAGVSRATLYRLFASCGGVDARLWELRLEAARAALSDPARPGRIGEIGAQFGFATAQHFSRRFSAYYGFNPKNLRPF